MRGDSVSKEAKVLARFGVIRDRSGDTERYLEGFEGSMITGSTILYRAVVLGEEPLAGISGVLGLE
jgi:hypothetical protein